MKVSTGGEQILVSVFYFHGFNFHFDNKYGTAFKHDFFFDYNMQG